MKTPQRRSEDEKGATAVMFALFMAVAVLCLSLALDTGATRAEIRSIQASADIISMDLARQLNGEKTGELKATMNGTLQRTLARNNLDEEGISYTLGKVNQTTGRFTATASHEVPNAVKVDIAGDRSRYFTAGDDEFHRSAISLGEPVAGGDCFTIGGWAATAGTTGQNGINAFFEKLIGQAGQTGWYFGNNGAFNGFNYVGLLSEEINITAVAKRMNYTTIQEFRNASVNLKNLYTAIRDQALQDGNAPNTVSLFDIALRPSTNMNPDREVDMSVILGENLLGTIHINTLDAFGGISMHLNNNTSVNPEFGNSLGNVFSQGPTNIIYNQGPRVHCAESGDRISTAGTNGNFQTTMLLNGSLNPGTYQGRVYSPGLINVTTDLQLGYVSLVARVEPVEMTMRSVTCTDTRKTAVFDLHKGDIDLSLGLDGGGTTYAGKSGLKANLGSYGPVIIDWGLPLSFRAYLDMAPSTGNVVTATEEDLGKPLYILDTAGRWKIDVEHAVNSFSYFRVIRDGGGWQEYSLTQSEQRRLKTAIVEAYVQPLLNPNGGSNGFFTGYMNGALGFSASSIYGPSVTFDNDSLTCGGASEDTKVRLVG